MHPVSTRSVPRPSARTVVLLAASVGLLGACDAGGGGFPDLPMDTDGQCTAVAGAGWVGASSADLTFNNLLINDAFQATDITNITGCVREDGTGAAWLIDDTAGNPLMAIINVNGNTGAQPVTSGTFLIDIYGYDPAISFSGADFFTEQWQINSLNPYQVSFEGSANNSGNHQLDLNYLATATP